MANPKALLDINKNQVSGDIFSDVSTKEMLRSTHTQELVIALCGPIGSPLHDVAKKLGEILRAPFGYDIRNIQLSQFIEDHANKTEKFINNSSPAERKLDLIRRGNEMRQNFGFSVLAELAVHKIRVDREINGKSETSQYTSRRICHIIDSIKNQGELELLRTVYRESLYVVGVFSPAESRVEMLGREGISNAEIASLMDIDSGEEISEGQTVAETFPQCDFFLRMDSNTETQLRSRVERFINLILGTQVITPTRSESAMYAAASAATNSGCLSRQVGSAVTDSEGEVLAIGWNDVPKAYGDLYVTNMVDDPSDDRDKRCWNYGGKCYNDEEKKLLAKQIVESLGDLISSKNKEQAINKVVSNRKLRSLIEFSRSIHAEMHAILTALRQKGDRVRGGRIYVTTYPCHSCARHIIAAGIKEVYYIEPYKKSLATKLHGDAMTENEQSANKVKLIPYDGVAPTRYLSLFRMTPNSRKKDGLVIRVAPAIATPKLEKSLEALPALEGLVVKSLAERSLINTIPESGGTGHEEA